MSNEGKKGALDFSKYIAERTQNFTGRQWVFEILDHWLTNREPERFFLLTGEPGSGKTAISSRLYQFSAGWITPPEGLSNLSQKGFLSAVHFCSARDSSWIDPRIFAHSIALQLSNTCDEYAKALIITLEKPVILNISQEVESAQNSKIAAVVIGNLVLSGPSAQEVFNRVVVEPLQRIYLQGFDRPLTILIDSLDEALVHQGDLNIVGLLSRLTGLPRMVRFILTSRPETRVENVIKADRLFISAPEYSKDNLNDIGKFVMDRLRVDEKLEAKIAGLTDAQIVDIAEMIKSKSEGNFQYVNFLLEALAQPHRALSDLDTLPTGLDALFYDSLRRVVELGWKDWENDYSPLMGLLSVARENLTLVQLQNFTAEKEREVLAKRTDLEQFIEQAQAGDDAGVDKYRLYHQSVVDFLGRQSIIVSNNLTNKMEKRSNTFYLPPGEWHKRIADYYVTDYAGEWQNWDDYGLRYTATHLAETAKRTNRRGPHEQLERLVKLVVNPNFQRAHKDQVKDITSLQRDLTLALKGAAQDEDARSLPLVLESALALVNFRREELRPEPIFELARQGEVEAARRRLELFTHSCEWQQIAWLTIACWLPTSSRKMPVACAIRSKISCPHTTRSRY
jgi:hypothetical protein